MSNTVISIEHLSKAYQLGQIGTGTLSRDINVWWAKMRGKPNPMLKMGERDHDNQDGETIWALKDVNFTVEQGEALGIIGRNGAGKSTLLKILSRVTAPTSGHARVKGRIASLLEVGTGFHPDLTGRENIYLNGAILGMGRKEIARKLDEIVAFAEIEQFIDTPVKRYSSGMYVRLAFAVAAHLDPEILVVDEVLAVGDAEFQKKCLGKMGDVARGGRTVLFVSHNMNAIEKLCNTAILIEKGEIALQNKDSHSVVEKYLSGGRDHLANTCWEVTNRKFANPYFSPIKFSLCDYKGNPIRSSISNQEDVWIRLESEINILDPALTMGFALFSEHGDLLFWSYQTDTCEKEWPRLHIGYNILQSQFPKNCLNEGAYRIEVIGGLHNRQWLFEPGRGNPEIQIEIRGGLSDSPLWINKRPGLMAPILTWKLVQ